MTDYGDIIHAYTEYCHIIATFLGIHIYKINYQAEAMSIRTWIHFMIPDGISCRNRGLYRRTKEELPKAGRKPVAVELFTE